MREPFLYDLNETALEVGVPAWQFTYALETFADFFDPLRIYLFGSRIWGEPKPWSDLDVCVIASNGQRNVLYEKLVKGGELHSMHVINRWREDTSQPLKVFPIDILLTDKEGFEEKLSHPATVEHKIYYKGKLLYTQPNLKFEENRPMIQAETTWINHAEEGLAMAIKAYEDTAHDFRISALLAAHQCVEMALSGYLAFYLKEPEKDHNILSLLARCFEIDPDFMMYIPQGERYTKNYYYRYRPDWKLPERNIVQHEIMLAEEILNLVKSKIATDQRPWTPMFHPETDELDLG